MPATQSAVMNKEVTGQAVASATRRPAKKKAKLNTAEIRAQIKTERVTLAECKNDLKGQKADLRDTLKTGKAKVLTATKALKAEVLAFNKSVKADERNVTICEKAVAKQESVISKLTAKLN